jgi:hypothetical protein
MRRNNKRYTIDLFMYICCALYISMSHIFFFPIKREESCVSHADIYLQDKVYEGCCGLAALNETDNGIISHYVNHMREVIILAI